MKLLHLGKPTLGDPHFYKRWETFGKVYTSLSDAANDLNQIEVVIIDHYTDFDDQHLNIFPILKYIISPTTGHTHLRFTPEKFNGEVLTLRGEKEFLEKICGVSEFTIHLMLKLCRELSPYPTLLNGKTIGVLGMGRIGTQVATRAEAMGMKVREFDKKHNQYYLKGLFINCDFISIHLEENTATRWLVSKNLIYNMKPSSFLINTARGSIINESALMNALIKKKIAGAAIDVKESNYYLNDKVPNLIITNHVAGRAIEDRIRTDEFMIRRLRDKLLETIRVQTEMF
jgi:phosphoglycerate dehydrogenase-like enzyme